MAMPAAVFDRPAWKTALNWTMAVLTAILFLVAGLYKITDPVGFAVKLSQLKFPEAYSLSAAILLGVTETFAGVLVLVPRYRRWGAAIASLMLLAFMLYVGFFYDALRGADCSCFPWVKRAVGPGFFVGDALMLVFAIGAGVWARRSENLKGAALILAAVAVFAGVSYGVDAARNTGTKAPNNIAVAGKPYSLTSGKVFLYFFDPVCMHCLEAGRKMSAMNWGDTRFVGVPVSDPQFAENFMQRTALNKPISTDWEILKKTFSVKGTPGGVALENGHEKAELTRFEGDEPAATLRKLAFIH
jgi:uncharacterized membrane protein YphA (DoxX/SURF4 family)